MLRRRTSAPVQDSGFYCPKSLGLAGHPACGDIMKLQIEVEEGTGTIQKAVFKVTFLHDFSQKHIDLWMWFSNRKQ